MEEIFCPNVELMCPGQHTEFVDQLEHWLVEACNGADQNGGQYGAQQHHGPTDVYDDWCGAPNIQELSFLAFLDNEYEPVQNPGPSTIAHIPNVAPQWTELLTFTPPATPGPAMTFDGILEYAPGSSVAPTFEEENRNDFMCPVKASVEASLKASVGASLKASVGASLKASVGASLKASVGASLKASVGASLKASVGASLKASVGASLKASVEALVEALVEAPVEASVEAPVLEKVKKPRESKVTGGPYIKKPPNAFMLFLKEHRKSVEEELGVRTSAVVNKFLGQRWKALSTEEKQRFTAGAKEQSLLHSIANPGWTNRNNYRQKRKRNNTKP